MYPEKSKKYTNFVVRNHLIGNWRKRFKNGINFKKLSGSIPNCIRNKMVICDIFQEIYPYFDLSVLLHCRQETFLAKLTEKLRNFKIHPSSSDIAWT